MTLETRAQSLWHIVETLLRAGKEPLAQRAFRWCLDYAFFCGLNLEKSVGSTASALCTESKAFFQDFDLTVWVILLSSKILRKRFIFSTLVALATIQLIFLG